MLKIDLLLFARQVESCHLQDVFKNKYYNFKQQYFRSVKLQFQESP